MLSETTEARLTPRKQEVLSAVCKGRTSKQIGLDLGIRPRTVEAYIEHIRLQLGAANRCHMVALAIAHGLYGEPDGVAQ